MLNKQFSKRQIAKHGVLSRLSKRSRNEQYIVANARHVTEITFIEIISVNVSKTFNDPVFVYILSKVSIF